MRSNNAYGMKSPEETIEATTRRNLEETSEFMIALNTKVGRLLFDDLVLLLDEKFKLIYTNEADDQDKAIFFACKYIGDRWNKLIDKNAKSTGMMKEIEDFKNRKKMK